ncbi:MAG TPA: MarR family transcriptional regulator [Pseudonocardiaceae bacterium]|nr:MarR family transcriptional regulator [Pseudonocardiaceae bacterium]
MAKRRDALATQVIDLMPEWVNQLLKLNGLIAARMGVVPTDFDCLHLLHRHGPTTAGVLAGHIGLTPGSVSRMIDRLADAGCVKRVPDPHDRRRLLVEPTEAGLARITAYYAGLTARTQENLATFDEDHLRALLRFVEVSTQSVTAEVDRLRGLPT